MKPLWSNKEISLPIAGIESDTEMLRVAELLRYIEISFHFHGRGMGSEDMPTPSVNHPGKHTEADL